MLYMSLDNSTSLPAMTGDYWQNTSGDGKVIAWGIFTTPIRQTVYWKADYAHTSGLLYFHAFQVGEVR